MITGAASADIAILIVDVNEGIKQQTKKHSYLLKLLGFEKVITLYNFTKTVTMKLTYTN